MSVLLNRETSRNIIMYSTEGGMNIEEVAEETPHLIHKDLWNEVGGFSEEFSPGLGSDPDFNMKLWKSGVRIFKCLNKSRVYHFGSILSLIHISEPTRRM